MRFHFLMAALLLAGCGGSGQNAGGPAGAEAVSRRVAETRPPGTSGPVNSQNQPVGPKVVPGFAGPIPTTDWWSSLIWPFNNRHSENLFAHPLAFRAQADGLVVGYPNQVTFPDNGNYYEYALQEDLRVRSQGLNAGETLVQSHSDWTVTARWGASFSATIGHGLPYVYVRTPGVAEVACAAPPTVFARSGSLVAFTLRGHHYALFGPSGSTWTQSGNTFRCDLGGRDYFSLALLPDPAALELFRTHAYAFVTDTRVSWSCADGNVRTRFEATVTPMESGNGLVDRPLQALYRHQWLRVQEPLTAHRYTSARGEMRLLDGAAFTTVTQATGILPNLPDAGNLDRPRLIAYLQAVASEPPPSSGMDSYWMGKALGRLAALAPLAEQAGRTDLRDRFLDRVQAILDDWLDGTAPSLFAYDSVWNTLIGYPASYGSDTSLNDHHFHYGYFIQAAAALARYRPEWAAAHQADVNEIIADSANHERGNLRYPFLRHFDPYAGHSWASGAQMFANGNNQESSSEALNFAGAVALWGAATGQPELRDLGVYLHTTESEAVGQYWFDVDQAVFPAGFEREEVGIVWSTGGAYTTFWTANPEEIHGINFLPLTGSSLYLGRWPEALQRNYQDLLGRNGGPEQEWKDIIQMALALADPAPALARFEADPGYASEAGESKAHTYHWLKTLEGLGRLEPAVTADWPAAAVFRKGDERSYAAFNPTAQAATVRFGDGRSFSVPPRQLALERGSAVALPSPTPVATPSPSPAVAPSPSPSPTPVVVPSPSPPPGAPSPSPAAASPARWFLTATGFQPAPGASPGAVSLASAEGANYDGTPHLAQSYLLTGVSGAYNGGVTRFTLPLDAGSAVATGTQARLSYDFNGDGQADRVETYHYFANNDVPGWENYGEARGLRSATGAWQDFRNGSLRLEVWNAIGRAPVSLRVDHSSAFVELPVSGSAPAPTPNATPTPAPSPSPSAPSGPFVGTLYPQAGGLTPQPGTGVLTVASADGINHDGQPYRPLTLRASGLTGRYRGGGTEFLLRLDAGNQVAFATQVRVSYDFTGDGQPDRVETYHYFPTNDVPGWETYTQGRGLRSTSGGWANFTNGSVTLEVWSALGRGPTQWNLDGSRLTLPFE